MLRDGAEAESLGRTIRPAERRTLLDHLAVHLPGAYRRFAALAWRGQERLRRGHPVRRAMAESVISRSYGAFNRNDLAALLPIYDPECVWDWSHFEGWPDEQIMRGPDGLRRGWLVFRDAWGDFRVEPSGWRDFGDLQMATCHMRATGSGSGLGLEKTWWQVAYARNGLVVRVANYTNAEEAMDAAKRSDGRSGL